ncbi:TcpQ domain-containing protein, partial [Catenovulum agarivorans]|uniref:TcpQ domain-containing protein n=1 Tax=Catenovulum agarivorans TaxID=1172192 RepID=UPI0009E286C6
MWFWIRHATAAIILIFLGAYIIMYDSPVITRDNINSASNSTQEGSRKAMEGFGNFYSDLKEKYDKAMAGQGDGQYVIDLKKPDSTLTQELHKIGVATRSVSGSWVGKRQNRRFVQGDTLRERMQEMAAEDNMHLIWWLDRDFVVKLPFRVEETTVGTLYKMSTAIDSDFERDVYAFFCPLQRTLVVTDIVEHYIRDNCAPARSED